MAFGSGGAGLAARMNGPIGAVNRGKGGPKPSVNLAQAYGNMGGKLPGYTYGGGPSGTFGYSGTSPVDMGQAYQNMQNGGRGTPGSSQQPVAGAPPVTQDTLQTPLDATALANIAANQFKVTNEINSATQGENATRTNLAAQIAQLQYAQPRAQLALEQQANQRGSLYSSVEGQNQGNLAYQYAGREGGLTDAANTRLAGLANQIAALQGGIPLYNAGQVAAAAGRLSQSAAALPTTPAGQAGLRTKSAAAGRPAPPGRVTGGGGGRISGQQPGRMNARTGGPVIKTGKGSVGRLAGKLAGSVTKPASVSSPSGLTATGRRPY